MNVLVVTVHLVLAALGLLASLACLTHAWRDRLALRDGNGRQAIAREALARNVGRVVAGVLFIGDAGLRLSPHTVSTSAAIREVVLIALALLLLVSAAHELRDRWRRS